MPSIIPSSEIQRKDHLAMSCPPVASPLYAQQISGCLAHRIGQMGLRQMELVQSLERLRPELARLRDEYEDGSLALLRVPEQSADIETARAALDTLSQGARDIIVFGTGGSSLGGQTLAHFTEWYVPTESGPRPERPRLRFYHNLDAATLNHTFTRFDLKTTRFIFISKSGGTAETLLQAMAAFQAAEDAGLRARFPTMFLGLSEPARPGADNGLRALCAHYGVPVLDHDPAVGGRFSVLTNVGLLPAMARNLDVQALRDGARQVVAALRRTPDPAAFPPAAGAAVAYTLEKERQIGVQVMMPYSDRLGRLSQWFVQLWAESLGKQGHGSTPLAALGPVDQHSQLQLFLDGPATHMVTLISTPAPPSGPRIRKELAQLCGVPYLGGRTAADLVAAEHNAIHDALIAAGRPVRRFDVPILDARALGALLMHFMLEVVLVARLAGINPFDQPAVETGKRLTRDYLAKTADESAT